MRKKVILVLLAGCLCCSTAAMVSYAETPAHALTIIASVTNLSVSKNTIAVGESVQLELEWSTGAKQSVFYSSSDENVAIVDQNGLITGVGNGTATITVSHSNIGTDKTITIDVSDDVETSKTYQTSELTLGTKLKKYDTLHYTGDGAGSCLNVVNTKGDYDLVYLNSGDYVLPFDAEIVGIDGLVMYVAPDIEGRDLSGRQNAFPSVIRSTEILICYAMTTISMTLSFLYFCRSITANTSVTARSESRRLTMTKRRSLLNLSMNSTGCLLQWMIMKHSLRKTEMYPFMATISFIVIPSIIVPVMR